MCVPYSTECPVLQQNPALCGSTLLVCCLPPDGGGIVQPPMDSGTSDDAEPGDASTPESGAIADSGGAAG
jgi:hypothetical protein